MALVRRLSDSSNPRSLASRFRARRFARLEAAVGRLGRPLRILDAGGTNEFWESTTWASDPACEIVLVNLEPQESLHANIKAVRGDVTDLSAFEDRSFDLAFSNSTIEHLFTLDRQEAMAREIRRVANAYWVQTPNFWFPVEPHFHWFGWQWLPEPARVAMIRRFRCGWRGPCSDPQRARELVREVRLLDGRELRSLFPDATILRERFLGLTKSWIVTRALDVSNTSALSR